MSVSRRHQRQRQAVRRGGQQGSATAPQREPKRVAIFVEPSPFTYVCGYKNRFCNAVRYLVEAGCEVLVVTTGRGINAPGADCSALVEQPASYQGARVLSAFSFGCPWYWQMPLSLALSPRIYNELKAFRPDVVHCSSPGVMVLAAKLYSWLLKLPLVLSYHTHIPSYLPRYSLAWLVPAMWLFTRFLHWAAHLTLTTSDAMREELVAARASRRERTEVWKKGVDSEEFHPRFRNEEMRSRLSGGCPQAPILVYVGRLGHEKNLRFLRGVLQALPQARLAFVGDGPARQDLEEHFRGTHTVFTGMLTGEALSAAYASADIFVMPSESETLGFVVLEAMASGLPVVAVRAGGIPDVITREGEVGYLYEPGDVESATAMVRRLVDDVELRRRVGQAAREEVGNWDWRAATLHLLRVQYPLAMAAAAAEVAAKLGSRTVSPAAAAP